jgi:hypothetical protein
MNNKPVHGDYIQGSPSNHPGVPVGNDKVPAWLAPNEFVVNQEATAMYGPQIEAMNNHGRAVQAQQGNSVPPMPAEAQYFEAGGLVNFLGSLFGQQSEVPAPQPTAQMAVPAMQTPAFIPPAGIQTPANDASIVRMAPHPSQVAAMPQEVPAQATPPAPSYDMFSGANFGNYANSIAQLESGGREDPYSIVGGSNDHYVGKYQLGADAISDASKFLGMENAPSREDVRKNPQLQERLFNAYTQVNHRTMEQLSTQYRNMDPTEQQRYLGYAHNQGAGGALEFMNTGVVGRDGFGTAGTNYMSAVARGQGANGWAPGDTSAARMTMPGVVPQAASSGVAPGQVPGVPEFEFNIPTLSSQPIGPQGGMPMPTPSSEFIPQGVSAQQGGANQVFQDPMFKMMADRSGLDAQGYWDSLHPDAKAQHTKRVNAGPAIYTDKSEIDTMNLVGANSSLAAIPGDFDMAQTAAGRSGSPMTPVVPAMDNTPAMPGVDADIVTNAPGSMEVPSMDAQPAAAAPSINPNAIPDAYREYGESRIEADYDSQQELDRITLQLQTTSRDAPAYEFLQERRAALLSNLGRNDPTYTGSIIPTPEVLGTDILANKDAAMNADLAVATETKAIQDAGMRGDMEAVAAAEARLTAAHKQKSDAVLEEADMVKTREANALEDQARKNADIQSEIVEFDTAIANATTPEGVAALTAGRDAAIERGTVPAMAPAGQGENLPSIDTETAAALKSKPKADPAVVTAVTDKVDEAVVAAEAEGETVPANLTSKDAEVAGDKAATADPSAFSGALGAIKDFFGDMFDAKELKRMAILYLGARVTGASGGASLAFAGKSYLSRMDAKQTAYEKVAAAGTYTKESIGIFKKTRDYNDLALKAVPSTQTGILKTFYDEKGNEVRAQQMQNGDNKFYVDGSGKQINPLAYSETKPADREAKITEAMGGVEAIVGDLRDQYSKDPESGQYSNAVIPSVDARKIAEWAVKNGVPPEQMGSVIDAAYHDMMNSKGGGREVRSLVPFIRQNVIRQKLTNNAGAFIVEPAADGKPAEYVAPHLLETLNRRASGFLESAGMAGNATNLSNQFYTAAMSDWNALTADERKKFNDGAGEGANGFYEFADDWLQNNNF